MDRAEKAKHFWGHKEPHVTTMLLQSDSFDADPYERAEILSHLPDLSGKKILDLASGIGRFTRPFCSLGKSLLSVDLMPHFIAKNRHDHGDCHNVSFLCADVIDLHLKEESFDFIFINWLFLYFEEGEIDLLLTRMSKWLKPGGEFFLRESCGPVRRKGYIAHYRPDSFYESALKNHFTILKSGYLRSYVDHFADPMQCFWVCQK